MDGIFHIIAILGLIIGLASLMWLVARHLKVSRQFMSRINSGPDNASGFLIHQFILDALPFPVWQRDSQCNITYCNQAYANIVGSNVHQVVEQQQELLDVSRTLAEHALQKKMPEQLRRHVVVDGKRLAYLFIEKPIGEQLIGYASDISREESLKQEYREYTQAQSELLSSSASAIAMFDRNKTLTFFNQAYATLWKLDPKWLEKKPTYSEVLDVLREKRKLPEQANFQAFKRDALGLFNNLIHKHEEYYYLPDDTVVRVVAVPHEHGGLLFSYEDMTDLVNLERSYNTLLSVKKSTIDHLNEGLLVVGQDGKVQLHNPAFCTMWQYDPLKLENEPLVSEVIDHIAGLASEKDGEQKEFRSHIKEVISERKSVQEQVFRTDQHAIMISYIPLPDGANLLIFNDVTDSYRVEQSLRAEKEALSEADNIKTKFLANVSYELRSPLTTIQGFAEALRSKLFGEVNEKQDEYLESILTSSERLKMLIDNVLDVASIDAGYMKLDITSFSVRSCFKVAIDEAKTTMPEKQLEIASSVEKGIRNVEADRTRIEQILIQLLRNSIRMTPKGGKVELFAELADDNHITMGVRDSGKGIPKEERDHIFETFYKLRADGYSGTGLGLSISKSFVELHGGTIAIDSEENEGTTISFTLPIKNPLKDA